MRRVALAVLVLVTAADCGGDSGETSTREWPAPGRWDAVQYQDTTIPVSRTENGVSSGIDSLWMQVAADGTVLQIVAGHSAPGGEWVDTLRGMFRHPEGNSTAVQLVFADGTGGSLPPATVTFDQTRITVEDWQTHARDVLVRR